MKQHQLAAHNCQFLQRIAFAVSCEVLRRFAPECPASVPRAAGRLQSARLLTFLRDDWGVAIMRTTPLGAGDVEIAAPGAFWLRQALRVCLCEPGEGQGRSRPVSQALRQGIRTLDFKGGC